MEKFISKLNSMEMKFYEFMQVLLFQKMVFALEKFIHRKDGGYNENYHFAGDGNKKASVADEFTKYLFYNGSIHAKNSIFLSACLIFKLFFIHKLDAYTAIMILLLIKDLYCIMLQRYNYLRIKKLKALESVRQARKKEKLIKRLSNCQIDSKAYENELNLVRKMRQQLDENGVIELVESDVIALRNIKSFLN